MPSGLFMALSSTIIYTSELTLCSTICYSPLGSKAPALKTKAMAAEPRFAEVSDEYLSSLLHESISKSTKKSTNKIWNDDI